MQYHDEHRLLKVLQRNRLIHLDHRLYLFYLFLLVMTPVDDDDDWGAVKSLPVDADKGSRETKSLLGSGISK